MIQVQTKTTGILDKSPQEVCFVWATQTEQFGSVIAERVVTGELALRVLLPEAQLLSECDTKSGTCLSNTALVWRGDHGQIIGESVVEKLNKKS